MRSLRSAIFSLLAGTVATAKPATAKPVIDVAGPACVCDPEQGALLAVTDLYPAPR